MDVISDGAGINRRNDGWYQEAIEVTVDQGVIEAAMDFASDESESNRKSDGW